MLPLEHKIAFLVFALTAGLLGTRGFYRLFQRIRAGREDTDARLDRLPSRIWYALTTAFLQRRTFRKRPVISVLHAFIFYGFTYYLLVNIIDGIEGYLPLHISSANWIGAIYSGIADILSALVLIGTLALVARRFALPARRDFRFNDRTLLHKDVQHRYISRDSLIVSGFILFHVGSRAIEMGAKIAAEGPDRMQPFASLLAHAFNANDAESWLIFGYWGALGSVLAFLVYFPYSKHIHIFMAPAKYLVARTAGSGTLPTLEVNLESEAEEGHKLGARKLEDLAWPRLLDAYACIQCNRCQDVCPATATGKSLSPAALEINKRMELNTLTKLHSDFEHGAPSPRSLLEFALTPEAAWACTTCGACMQVCPVQDEQMLDIVDIRRHQVMLEGEFPTQLQSAFRGMERTHNPWGINHDQRMAWAEGLGIKSIDENPDPDVLYWVGCAASYDPQSQKTARALVQLLDRAGVNFAVLGKKECCTGDSARRAGNELLYLDLAKRNIETLNRCRPKLIVTTCPHCMNALGHEYRQLGGHYRVVHHTQYLAELMAEGRLDADALPDRITYHDPCYLGRHNGVYDAPRDILHVLSNDFVELGRTRENSFCCGAGGGQFWKEEEAGSERISQNRYREAQAALGNQDGGKVLAVGCPFCKSMLGSAPGKSGTDELVIKDVAELLLDGVQRKSGERASVADIVPPIAQPTEASATVAAKAKERPVRADSDPQLEALSSAHIAAPTVERKKWRMKSANTEDLPAATNDLAPSAVPDTGAVIVASPTPSANGVEAENQAKRKKWAPKSTGEN